MKILVIGSINIDLFIKTDLKPDIGETVIGESFVQLHGGKGANQAIAAARLNSDVTFLGAVGNDQNGKLAIKNLEDNNVNTNHIQVIDGVATGVANVISYQGDNSIIVVKGANEYVDVDLIKQKEQLIIDHDIILLQNEIPLTAVKQAIDLANKHGKTIVYNPAPYVDGSEWLIKDVTYATPNEHEAKTLDKLDNLITTMGELGVMYQSELIKAYKVTPVDTTGAGDTFNGAFCSALTKGMNVIDAIKFGNRASSIAIQTVGAQVGMPYIEDMDA